MTKSADCFKSCRKLSVRDVSELTFALFRQWCLLHGRPDFREWFKHCIEHRAWAVTITKMLERIRLNDVPRDVTVVEMGEELIRQCAFEASLHELGPYEAEEDLERRITAWRVSLLKAYPTLGLLGTDEGDWVELALDSVYGLLSELDELQLIV